MSLDEALKTWKDTMRKLDFLLQHDNSVMDQNGNTEDWFNQWLNEYNNTLMELEEHYPQLINLM